jgi:hypothetical protein
MTDLKKIPRPEKRDIALALHTNLAQRLAKGAPEPALDAYITELADVGQALNAPIVGSLVADAERSARLGQLDGVDCDVDTWYRHVEGFIDVEARRRVGPNVALALALHTAGFPDGLAHVDDPVPDENRLCRESLTVLRSAEYAPTVAAIGLPLAWLTSWEASLTESESLYAAIAQARTARKTHVGAGQDAEVEFIEIGVRLRRYVGSRAASSDKARVAEGKTLLAPLLDALARLRATAAARATHRETVKEKGKKAEPAAPPVAPVAPTEVKPG